MHTCHWPGVSSKGAMRWEAWLLKKPATLASMRRSSLSNGLIRLKYLQFLHPPEPCLSALPCNPSCRRYLYLVRASLILSCTRLRAIQRVLLSDQMRFRPPSKEMYRNRNCKVQVHKIATDTTPQLE